jgi:hypothetical protein
MCERKRNTGECSSPINLSGISPICDNLLRKEIVMKINGGTPAALKLIKELTDSGNLIDIYDRERIKAEKEPYLVTLEMMDEFDKKHGTQYHNHLLAIFIDDGVDTKELISVYPDFAEVFNSQVYEPSLIFINLATHQVYACTRTRKGRTISTFIPHPSGIKEIGSVAKSMYIDDLAQERNDLLRKLDYASVIDIFENTLATIASSDYDLVYREIDSGHIQDMLARGPNKHGVYIKESWGDEEEDEQEDGITQDELDDAIEEIEDLESDLTDALEIFSKFFPERAIELENFLRDD